MLEGANNFPGPDSVAPKSLGLKVEFLWFLNKDRPIPSSYFSSTAIVILSAPSMIAFPQEPAR
jgi:hypothetical protein